MLANLGLVTLGVDVDRDEPSDSNGMTWRVTFLDDSPVTGLPASNFKLELEMNALKTVSGKTASVRLTPLVVGQVFPPCARTAWVVPSDITTPLTLGQYYSARVFAGNEVGYSLPQSALSQQKPMVVPGAPTGVALSVFSGTGLRVFFNPPSSTGGDTITSYKIEYSRNQNFSSTQIALYTNLAAGAPFARVLEGLTNGAMYYVRVSCANQQGYGPTQVLYSE